MTREEYIKVCSVCKNRSFSPKQGIICGLTQAPADFKGNCTDFDEDENEIRHNEMRENYDVKQTRKGINKGRIALFVVGGLYFLIGVFEGFFMFGAELIYGLIDWGVAAVFIGLGFWSYQKASLALMIGLGFYLLIILLAAVIDPINIIRGIIWKVLIIAWLVYGISAARQDEAKNKKTESNGDLLDQL